MSANKSDEGQKLGKVSDLHFFDSSDSLHVLLSAYACEPGRGSEPGVGWEWAIRLSLSCKVTVVTRANNRQVIEDAIGRANHNLTFHYYDLPRWVLGLKRQGFFPTSVYYLLWQFAVARRFRKHEKSFDLIHHVTFNGFRFPGAWWRASVPVVLGPLGGGSIASHAYRKSFRWRWFWEMIRASSVMLWAWNPWTWKSLKRADRVLVVGKELEQRLLSGGVLAGQMLETGLPQELEVARKVIPAEGRRDFLWVGSLEPWKAPELAIEAMAACLAQGMTGHRLVFVGAGRMENRLRSKVLRLGLSDSIVFAGSVGREEVWKRMEATRALLFTSVRDTSGNVVLEAMGLCCPVVCFRHQGVEMITDSSSAIQIEPGSWELSVNAFSQAMLSLAKDDDLVRQMGETGRARAVGEFSWDVKVAKMMQIYRDVIERKMPS